MPTLNLQGTNRDVADLLFLRLAEPGPTLRTVGDAGFRPALARSWSRRDSLTLVFDLDPRARWHDGRPVTADDVVFTFERGRRGDPILETALRRIAGATAEGPSRVVVRFREAYAEQFYDATWHLHILPAHLLRAVPRDSLAASAYAKAPVGSGPYRWVRRVSGQLVELAAAPDHFLGTPKVRRVVFRVATDADARLNLLLSGEADLVQAVSQPAAERVGARQDLLVVPVPGNGIVYVNFNHRAHGDRSRPHPILDDVRVRQALVLALDRAGMVRAVYGPTASVPDGPVPQIFAWLPDPADPPGAPDTARARALLAQAGWTDRDGDGWLDRDGAPLALSIILPNRTPQRPLLAQQMQEQLRRLGVRLDLQVLEWTTFLERRNAGQFDLDFASAGLDPTPSGLRNSWTCATAGREGQNVGSWCDPTFDSLLEAGARTVGDGAAGYYQQALRRLRAAAPAIFFAAPATLVAVHGRYANRPLRPEGLFLSLREWSVRPDRQLPRDRTAGP